MLRLLFRIDWVLVIPTILVSIMGIITLVSFHIHSVQIVTVGLIIKHSISIVLGIFIAFLLSNIDYRGLSTLIRPLFFVIIGLLVLVLLIGNTVNGAKSWFSFGGFNIQPAELAKIVVIIIIAQYFNRYHYRLNSFWTIITSLLPISIIGILILIQPDFGTFSIIGSIWLGMIVFGGVRFQHIIILFSAGIVSLLSLWIWILKEYQKQRILTFFDPTLDPLGSGYNTLQVIKSVSAGGWLGNGSQLITVPEIHTDFIFAGFAQQWGFIGISVYFILMICILGRMIYIGLKIQDGFARMIILGIILCFLIQMLINIGMNIGILPITGITLPFMSYGGSSMIVSWVLIGLLLSIKNHQEAKGTIFMRDNQDIFG
jgi:rod shape determining protein RodA